MMVCSPIDLNRRGETSQNLEGEVTLKGLEKCRQVEWRRVSG
jgi:hypothetical protein